jgi:hypothetical protein
MFQKSKLYLGKSLVVTIIMILSVTQPIPEVQKSLTMKINNMLLLGVEY